MPFRLIMENSKQSAFGYGFANEQSHFDSPGLTKLELIAKDAMVGLLSANPDILHGNIDLPVPSEIAKKSVEYAKALLKELEKS